MMNQILFYDHDGYYYSNFSAFAVFWRGVLWMTAEHAYQAAKFTDPAIINVIRNAWSAHDAKKIARANQASIRPDWDEETKLAVMEEIVRAKHNQHPYIQEKLFNSDDAELIEDSSKDSFWGRGPDWLGLNHLGKIWMMIRSEKRVRRV